MSVEQLLGLRQLLAERLVALEERLAGFGFGGRQVCGLPTKIWSASASIC